MTSCRSPHESPFRRLYFAFSRISFYSANPLHPVPRIFQVDPCSVSRSSTAGTVQRDRGPENAVAKRNANRAGAALVSWTKTPVLPAVCLFSPPDSFAESSGEFWGHRIRPPRPHLQLVEYYTLPRARYCRRAGTWLAPLSLSDGNAVDGQISRFTLRRTGEEIFKRLFDNLWKILWTCRVG